MISITKNSSNFGRKTNLSSRFTMINGSLVFTNALNRTGAIKLITRASLNIKPENIGKINLVPSTSTRFMEQAIHYYHAHNSPSSVYITIIVLRKFDTDLNRDKTLGNLPFKIAPAHASSHWSIEVCSGLLYLTQSHWRYDK